MRYLISRRITQVSIILLYMAANIWGVKILEGNLSSSLLLGTVPLSDPFAVLQMFVAGSIITMDIFIGALIITIFYALIGGRMFCSWVCPINIVTDAANLLRRKLGISAIQKRVYMSRNIRYWVLGLSLLLSFLMGLTAFELISPISILHRGLIFGMGFGLSVVLIIFFFDLLVHENGWCGYVCPLGGFYSLIGKYSLIRVAHNTQKCTECMECKVVCPEKEVLFMVGKSSETVEMGACTNCARCIEVCNDDALNFSIRSYINKNRS
ncbi:quinol dehydrogenase ferredoxin subunit NapH [Sulfurimonas aquatica]|uniref:Quinol dehydrogenase ferredoxin subunit NapH n=1 Tax=Sulfurimonas aquatica TaxID=2672570 RepID=A0A975GD34_9BACT|nr:quinol dehydrogenase ferredoxin subunit NapH [Sulfurimonas aquatica]QSZ42321.1 quinol dehydrogenase ferredoxin subunit NapH [Sulfurimonas aquatica]